MSDTCRFKTCVFAFADLQCICIEVCFDAIKSVAGGTDAAHSPHASEAPGVNNSPPATLISTLRIFKEQATSQPQTSTSLLNTAHARVYKMLRFATHARAQRQEVFGGG